MASDKKIALGLHVDDEYIRFVWVSIDHPNDYKLASVEISPLLHNKVPEHAIAWVASNLKALSGRPLVPSTDIIAISQTTDGLAISFTDTAFKPVTGQSLLGDIVKASLDKVTADHGVSFIDCTAAVDLRCNDVERQAVKRAVEAAGLHVLRIINDATASCIGYDLLKLYEGVQECQQGIVVNYCHPAKLTLLNIEEGIFEIMSTIAVEHSSVEKRLVQLLKKHVEFVSKSDAKGGEVESVVHQKLKDKEWPQKVRINGVEIRPSKLQELEMYAMEIISEELLAKLDLRVLNNPKDLKFLIFCGNEVSAKDVEYCAGLFTEAKVYDADSQSAIVLGLLKQCKILMGLEKKSDLLICCCFPG